MVRNFHLTPVLCAAIGTAVGFYLFSSISPARLLAVALVLLAVLCFLRVIADAREKIAGNNVRIVVLCGVALSAGFMLGLCAKSAGRNVIKFAIPREKITAVEGVLLEDPRIFDKDGRAMAVLSLRRCAGGGKLRASSSGNITVFFPQDSALRLREFGRGAAVFSEGKLRETDTGFVFSAESMHVVNPARTVQRMRTGIRLKFISMFNGKEWGGLALALLLGIRDNLDTNLSAMYRDAGCSYILALSGMHLAVLAALISFFLKKPLGFKGASIAGALIICLYCFIVGPMPSLNRAMIMYLLGVVTLLGAFPKEPLSILALSFLIQIVTSPSQGNSLSFILSYSALGGILLIGQPLYSLFSGKAPDFILMPLTASFSAFLITAGITSSAFGVLAPAGIVIGLALVPLTTVFMIGSMLWLVLDLFSLSFVLSVPLSLLYRLMEKIVSLAGNVPRVSASMPAVILFISITAVVLIAVFEYRRRTEVNRLAPFS
ncbi:MAG: ComEC/Rec2 family competence protein [Treponema sp.]|jgi:competence protein ComEC|nr:ComEC/Rec2 family competence protein [Treponema sp.]